MTNQTKKTVSKQKMITKRIRMVSAYVLYCIAIITLVTVGFNNSERFIKPASRQLMLAVEAEEDWAIEKFNKYIEKDVYLWNGPITMNAMADKYRLDYEDLKSGFEASGYDSLQKFFDDVVEPMVKQ